MTERERDRRVTYVSGIERGLRNASLVNLDRLAAGLGMSLPALMAAINELRPGG